MLSFGRSSYMRFNHPAEAKHLKSTLPNSRISMAPISFSLGENLDNHQLERKPPLAPRKSPRNSYTDDQPEGFIGKLTKFEMLARQGRGVCLSPKVFPAGSGTANVPADQILGYSRSSSLASLQAKNQNNNNNNNNGNIDRSRSNTPTVMQQLVPSGNNSDVYGKPICKRIYLENNNENNRNEDNRIIGMSQSLVCQRSSDYDNFGNSRDYDMSQSLIVAKTTTEYFQVEQFGSNPNIRESEQQQQQQQTQGANANLQRRIHPPSPAFNRNLKYNEQARRNQPTYGRVKSPTPSIGSSCSIEELRERQADAENKRREAESRRRQAQEERLREQEIERQEKMRLEEILAMCAEYEKQSTADLRPRQPNR